MTQEDFACIERSLQVKLPPSYTKLMIHYAPDNPDAEWALLNTSNEIIKINKCLRDNGFFDMNWPPNFFGIGEDGAGNVYFLNLNQTESPVYFGDHEVLRFIETAVNFQAWCLEKFGMGEDGNHSDY